MKKQQGMSIVGFLLTASIVGFLVLTGIKLVPVYIEYKSVKQAMDGAISAEDGSKNKSAAEIRSSLAKRMSMNYVTSVKASDVKITPEDGGYTLEVDYQAEKPLLGNVFLVVKFNHEVSTSGN